jgi:penicillin-binding protein 1A
VAEIEKPVRPPRFARLRRAPWGKIAIATVAMIVVIALVPPLRRAAALGASRVILFAASPLAPALGDLDTLAQTTRIVAADGSPLAELAGDESREEIDLERLPEHVQKAVLAAEDEEFYEHSGVDPSAVFRAFVRTAQGQTQGGSTITQQLAKLNYTGRQRTVFRKLKEVLYASKLEREYTKDELLERYLNQVYFGEGSYGINGAAQTFFGVTADRLSPAQAALLAGKIRAPEANDPRRDPEESKTRRDQVLRNMEEEGWLEQNELDAALAEPIALAPERPSEAAKAPHFVEYVKREAASIEELGGAPERRQRELLTGGYLVETTLDPKAFDASVESVQKELGRPGEPSAAVVSVQPGDGAIRNLFGGLTFARQFDVASQGRRQPGSAYKPFVYMAMLRQGIDPRSLFDARSPQTFEYRGEKFETSNYEEEGGEGMVNADDALVRSINTVYMRIGLEVTPPRVVSVGRDLQAPSDPDAIRSVASVSLGGLSKGVTPLEMAAAYAAFAAKGVYAEPYAIARIKDRDGKVVFERKPKTISVFEDKEVGVLNHPMQRVVREGTGKGANIGRPVAGKTGTTQNYGDAWFVGYTPQLATAVWVGHPDEIKPMLNVRGRRVSGGSFPATIFAATMRRALEGQPPLQLFTARIEDLDLERFEPPPPSPPPPGETTTTSPTSSTSSTSTSTSTTTTTDRDATSSTSSSTTSSTTTTQRPTTTTTQRQSTTTTTTGS